MNQKSRMLIQQEYDTKDKTLRIANSGDYDALHRCLLELMDDADCNARWGNVANVHVDFKSAIEEALLSYEEGRIDAKTALRIIAEADALAKNDQRDGLLLIDELFGLHDGLIRTKTVEQQLLATSGTTDWSKLNRYRYPNIYASAEASTVAPMPSQIDNLMLRINFFLEDKDWEKAETYIDKVLDIDATYAPAYLAKVLIKYGLTSESSLTSLRKPIGDDPDWQKALSFADTQQKQTYNSYAKAINNNEAYDKEQIRIAAEKARIFAETKKKKRKI